MIVPEVYWSVPKAVKDLEKLKEAKGVRLVGTGVSEQVTPRFYTSGIGRRSNGRRLRCIAYLHSVLQAAYFLGFHAQPSKYEDGLSNFLYLTINHHIKDTMGVVGIQPLIRPLQPSFYRAAEDYSSRRSAQAQKGDKITSFDADAKERLRLGAAQHDLEQGVTGRGGVGAAGRAMGHAGAVRTALKRAVHSVAKKAMHASSASTAADAHQRGLPPKEELVIIDDDTVSRLPPGFEDLLRTELSVDVVRVFNFTQAQLRGLFARAKVFIDGYVPGLERGLLEASLFDVVPVVNGVPLGSSFDVDIPLAPQLQVKDFTNPDEILAAVEYALGNYDELTAPGGGASSVKNAVYAWREHWDAGLHYYFSSMALLFVVPAVDDALDTTSGDAGSTASSAPTASRVARPEAVAEATGMILLQYPLAEVAVAADGIIEEESMVDQHLSTNAAASPLAVSGWTSQFENLTHELRHHALSVSVGPAAPTTATSSSIFSEPADARPPNTVHFPGWPLTLPFPDPKVAARHDIIVWTPAHVRITSYHFVDELYRTTLQHAPTRQSDVRIKGFPPAVLALPTLAVFRYLGCSRSGGAGEHNDASGLETAVAIGYKISAAVGAALRDSAAETDMDANGCRTITLGEGTGQQRHSNVVVCSFDVTEAAPYFYTAAADTFGRDGSDGPADVVDDGLCGVESLSAEANNHLLELIDRQPACFQRLIRSPYPRGLLMDGIV